MGWGNRPAQDRMSMKAVAEWGKVGHPRKGWASKRGEVGKSRTVQEVPGQKA